MRKIKMLNLLIWVVLVYLMIAVKSGHFDASEWPKDFRVLHLIISLTSFSFYEFFKKSHSK